MTTPLPTFEKELFHVEQGRKMIAGVDEVGRGPVAGPIVSAAVIFDLDTLPEIPEGYIKDSKKIAEKKREKSVEYIKEYALGIGLGVVDSTDVDDLGISKANQLSFHRAIENLNIKPDYILVDGNLKFNSPIPYSTIVKGDLHCYSIAAASIIAKVYRDNLMHELSKSFPQYGFERNKGYGTAEHMTAIREFGLSKHHRTSFLKSLSGVAT